MEDDAGAGTGSGCPVGGGRRATTNSDWWPDRLDLSVLRAHITRATPLGERFDYAAAFATVDLGELARDVTSAMTTSQEWWPADYGSYGPLFVRMAWHSAGTYRVSDGRGGGGAGAQRFAPLNSWPDNANLDKARRLLWPVKQKYGRRVSWADLLIFAGTCALEVMGVRTIGFGGGREDAWSEEDVDWGPERTWLGEERYSGDRQLAPPFGAVQMGLIYVNPEGPNGTPDPLAAARDIRVTFARMAMDDEETVALIVGGHTFGKAHGAMPQKGYVGREPEGARIEEQGLGWHNAYGTGVGPDTFTSGLEGAWTANPLAWDNDFLSTLLEHDWELTQSPAGAAQWRPTEATRTATVPDAHDPSLRHAPVMLTTDLALKADPDYRAIAQRFHAHPDELASAFAEAWFKLTHRDMGPLSRYVGARVPREPRRWQDPVPAVDHELVGEREVEELARRVRASGLSVSELVSTAWASASTFRGTDKRGGANGARLRLAPQRDWAVNEPAVLAPVLRTLEAIHAAFNADREAARSAVRISLADLIVLAGCVGIEEAARRAGREITVPFAPGRTDASQEATDVASFAYLEPVADGFRNYRSAHGAVASDHQLVERANLLTLTAWEMTVLVGGMRVLGANVGTSAHGVLTERPGVLTHDFFVHLLDMATQWRPSATDEHVYEGVERATGRVRWTATAVDLIFGSSAELRAIAEVYAACDGEDQFVRDFVVAWDKVMTLDRFDLPGPRRAGERF